MAARRSRPVRPRECDPGASGGTVAQPCDRRARVSQVDGGSTLRLWRGPANPRFALTRTARRVTLASLHTPCPTVSSRAVAFSRSFVRRSCGRSLRSRNAARHRASGREVDARVQTDGASATVARLAPMMRARLRCSASPFLEFSLACETAPARPFLPRALPCASRGRRRPPLAGGGPRLERAAM